MQTTCCGDATVSHGGFIVVRGNGAREKPSIWKTITIGGLSASELLRELTNDCLVGKAALTTIGSRPFHTRITHEQVNLAVMSISDIVTARSLGTKVSITDKVLAEWNRKNPSSFAIEACPPEVGPHLRLQYRDQVIGERLWIFARAAGDSGERMSTFYVEKRADGFMRIDCGYANPTFRWARDKRFVFRLGVVGQR